MNHCGTGTGVKGGCHSVPRTQTEPNAELWVGLPGGRGSEGAVGLGVMHGIGLGLKPVPGVGPPLHELHLPWDGDTLRHHGWPYTLSLGTSTQC